MPILKYLLHKINKVLLYLRVFFKLTIQKSEPLAGLNLVIRDNLVVLPWATELKWGNPAI